MIADQIRKIAEQENVSVFGISSALEMADEPGDDDCEQLLQFALIIN